MAPYVAVAEELWLAMSPLSRLRAGRLFGVLGALPIFAARNSLFLCRMDIFPGDIAACLLLVYTSRNTHRLCFRCSTPPSCVEAFLGAPSAPCGCRWLLDVPLKHCPLQPLVVAVPPKHWPLQSLVVAVPPKHWPLQSLVVAVPPKHWPLQSLALHCGRQQEAPSSTVEDF